MGKKRDRFRHGRVNAKAAGSIFENEYLTLASGKYFGLTPTADSDIACTDKQAIAFKAKREF